MADVRSFDDIDVSVADLLTQLEDFKSTASVRMVVRPTGTLETTIRTTPPAGALLCNGQTVLRADYPALLQFAIDNAILGGTNPVFGAGDGSTTFVLPNMTGRALVTAGTLGADTYVLGTTVGTAKPVLSSAQMVAHTHPLTTSSGDGSHGNHQSFHWTNVGAPLVTNGNQINGGDITGGGHSHSGTTTSTGGTTALDVRQPWLVTNYMVWA